MLINLLFISHCVISHKGNQAILKNFIEQTHNLKIIIFDVEQHYISSDEYAKILDVKSEFINDVLWSAPLPTEHYDDSMTAQIVDYIKNLKPKNVCSFAILDNENHQLAKTFPNNYVELHMKDMSEKTENCIHYIFSHFGTDRLIAGTSTFFVADTHFYHKNIIRYCNRPWNSGVDDTGQLIVTDADVMRMNEKLIENWNSIVKKDDVVWHLGDFSFGKKTNILAIVSRLNGRINLVLGNHDKESIDFYYAAGFHRVYDHPIIINNYVILSHVPLQFLNKNTPFVNIAGHVHDSTAFNTWSPTQCIVSIERHNYAPVSWKTISEKFEELREEN